MKVVIELDANDAKFLIDSSRRFITWAEKHPNDVIGSDNNLETWKRIRDAVDNAKTA